MMGMKKKSHSEKNNSKTSKVKMVMGMKEKNTRNEIHSRSTNDGGEAIEY